MAKAYHYQKRIELYHLDGAQIIFYGQLFYIIHDAFAQFLRDHKLSIKDRLNSLDYVFPVVHTEANYLKPIVLDDVVDIEQTVGKIGEKAFRLNYSLKVNGFEVANASVIHAMVDPKNMQTIEIPKEFLAVLKNKFD